MPVPSVTIDIVGQHYKKGIGVLTLKKEPPHADSIHSAGKYPTHVARRIFFF